MIPSLDGLRALSICLVILTHIAGPGEGHSLAFRLLLPHGILGVRIFFIISGFLITTLLLQERNSFGSISLKLFYARRALRILPAFFLFLSGLWLLRHFGVISFASIDFAYAITYTVNFAPSISWWMVHLWSLSVEEQFYILWPLAMRYFSRRTCAWVAVISVLSGILIGMIHRMTGIYLVDPKLIFAFPFTCGSIAFGCLAALFYPKLQPYLDAKWVSILCLLGIPLVWLLDTLARDVFAYIAVVVNDAILTLCVCRCVQVQGDIVSRLLNSRLLVWIGKLSYSIYLWQQLFFSPGKLLVPPPFNLGITLVLAMLSFYLLERPFLKLRRKLSRSTSDRAALSAR